MSSGSESDVSFLSVASSSPMRRGDRDGEAQLSRAMEVLSVRTEPEKTGQTGGRRRLRIKRHSDSSLDSRDAEKSPNKQAEVIELVSSSESDSELSEDDDVLLVSPSFPPPCAKGCNSAKSKGRAARFIDLEARSELGLDSSFDSRPNEYEFDSFLVPDDDEDDYSSEDDDDEEEEFENRHKHKRNSFASASVSVIDLVGSEFGSNASSPLSHWSEDNGEQEHVHDDGCASGNESENQENEGPWDPTMSSSQLAKLVPTTVQRWSYKVFDGKLNDVTVTWSKKLLTTAGVTRLRTTASGERSATIELSTKVIDRQSRLEKTLLHEMCHVAAFYFDGVSNPPHGPCFKKWAKRASKHVSSPVTTKHSFVVIKKHSLTCSGCGVNEQRHSNKACICKLCGGRMESTTKKPASSFALFVQKEYASARARTQSHQQAMRMLSQTWTTLKSQP